MSKHSKVRREFWRTTHLLVENAVTNNIVLIQGLGLCPLIGVSTTLQNGVVQIHHCLRSTVCARVLVQHQC